MIGALVKKAVAQTGADYNPIAAVSWDTVVYASRTVFSPGSPTLLTVPAEWNGYTGIVTCCMSLEACANRVHLYIAKNGSADYIGWGGFRHSGVAAGNGHSATQQWVQCQTGPITLTTGDTFNVFLETADDDSITVEAHSTFGIYVKEAAHTEKCLCKMSADQTTANYSTPAVIAFDGADVFDTSAFHDPSSNNTKIIVPLAVNGKFGVLAGTVRATSDAAGVGSLGIRKNGSLAWTGFGGQSAICTFTGKTFTVCSQAVQLVTGDEYELMYYTADTSITVEDETTFGLYVVGG